ncbi:Bdr family repetitive protein (plasmid) [Borreliella yangtzensis]|uniref:Bdr family repetitive protein n=1 Tax=Borreliella yangtzensis TaxID=683292 RepID=UPI003B21F1B8
MNNLAYRTYNIESIKNEFLNIGFSEEAIDFVFLHNDNYNFEFLKEKIIDVEKNLRKDISNLDVKMDNVEKNLNTKIDSVEKNLQKDISMLDTKIDNVSAKIDSVEKNLQKDISMLDTKIDNVSAKIDSVEKNLQKDISILNTKIDNEVKNLRKDLNMGNRLVHFMILAAAIFGPFIHSFLTQYIQGVK